MTVQLNPPEPPRAERPPTIHDLSFGPEHRLHSNRDYGRAFHRQQKAGGKHVVVLVNPRSRRSGGKPRLGVMMSAKAVRTSVRRHQLKRWVRELFRTRLKPVLDGFDAVVLFRCDLPDHEDAHARLDEEIATLAAKAVKAQATPGQRGGKRGGGRR